MSSKKRTMSKPIQRYKGVYWANARAKSWKAQLPVHGNRSKRKQIHHPDAEFYKLFGKQRPSPPYNTRLDEYCFALTVQRIVSENEKSTYKDRQYGKLNKGIDKSWDSPKWKADEVVSVVHGTSNNQRTNNRSARALFNSSSGSLTRAQVLLSSSHVIAQSGTLVVTVPDQQSTTRNSRVRHAPGFCTGLDLVTDAVYYELHNERIKSSQRGGLNESFSESRQTYSRVSTSILVSNQSNAIEFDSPADRKFVSAMEVEDNDDCAAVSPHFFREVEHQDLTNSSASSCAAMSPAESPLLYDEPGEREEELIRLSVSSSLESMGLSPFASTSYMEAEYSSQLTSQQDQGEVFQSSWLEQYIQDESEFYKQLPAMVNIDDLTNLLVTFPPFSSDPSAETSARHAAVNAWADITGSSQHGHVDKTPDTKVVTWLMSRWNVNKQAFELSTSSSPI